MKPIIFAIIINCFCTKVYSQNIHFGYPVSMEKIKKNDKIILNIPNHVDGRFLPEGGINKLIELLNMDSTFFFRIEIHYFYGSKEFAEDYSKYISNRLKVYLESSCTYSNYELFGYGRFFPVFLNQHAVGYGEMNTRMEVLVK